MQLSQNPGYGESRWITFTIEGFQTQQLRFKFNLDLAFGYNHCFGKKYSSLESFGRIEYKNLGELCFCHENEFPKISLNSKQWEIALEGCSNGRA